MGRSGPDDFTSHRPGPMSALVVYQAGFFAACCWSWLAVLVVRGDPVSGWHIAAAAGAITLTLTSVVLGARHALQRNAAMRHEQIFRALVDISWDSFAQSARSPSNGEADPRLGDADVIRLPPEPRPRPRR
jgi:hypothetical protein